MCSCSGILHYYICYRYTCVKMVYSVRMKLALAFLCLAACLQVAYGGGWFGGHITYYGSSNGGGTMGMLTHHFNFFHKLVALQMVNASRIYMSRITVGTHISKMLHRPLC